MPVIRLALNLDMAVNVVAMSMGVMPASCNSDNLARAGQGQDAEQEKHDSNSEFHRQAKPRRDHDTEQNDGPAHHHDCDRVSNAPGCPDHRRSTHSALTTDDCANGDDVVRVGGVPHAEEEAEKEQGEDVSSGFRHLAARLP
jgi:hypothetical protein